MRVAIVLAMLLSAAAARVWAQEVTAVATPEVAPPETTSTATAYTPEAIAAAVENAIEGDATVAGADVEVAVEGNTVTLMGPVDSAASRENAAAIAATVSGVAEVKNNLYVKPEQAYDNAELAQQVREALLLSPVTDAYQVTVTADEGTVVLTGVVNTWPEKRIAGELAVTVEGVQVVENNLEVQGVSDFEDAQIQEAIVQRLRWDTLVDHAGITVQVNSGTVLLSGVVGSLAEKNRAIDRAWVPGVTAVDAGGLTVSGWRPSPERIAGKYDTADTAAVERAVRDALALNPYVDATDIAVSVAGTTATLRGTVSSLAEKYAAGQEARGIVGVQSVNNELVVAYGEEGADEDLLVQLQHALARDAYVGGDDVTVRLEGDTVHLSGDVDSYVAKAQAENLARQMRGITQVVNNLTVRGAGSWTTTPYTTTWQPQDYAWYTRTPVGGTRTNEELIADIERQFFWTPFVDGGDIEIAADGGTVTLTGTVDSYREAEAAELNAYEAGAARVENKLIIGTVAD